MNLTSAYAFALAAFNFYLMIWSISNKSWGFAINLAASILFLFMGIIEL